MADHAIGHTDEGREEQAEHKRLSFTRFDAILLFIFALTLTIIASDFVLIWTEHEQYAAGFWQFVTPVCTGEIVAFSLYQIAKKVTGNIPKHSRSTSNLVDDVESDEETEDKK